MKVPFIDLGPVTALVKDAAFRAWDRSVDAREFVGGPSVAALERALSQRLGTRQVVTCGSGSAAILIALQALGIGPGSKVALPNLTFWASYEPIVHVGATPVLIDVDPSHLQLDFGQFVGAYETIGFDAAILVHLMGWATPQLGEFRAFCRAKGIHLIEDGAQSFATKVHGRSVYEGAQVSTLSFYPAKVIGGCMDGGAVLTDNEALAAVVRKLCNHGRTSHYAYSHVGWNSRMSGLQAAWLLEVLAQEQTIVQQRRNLEATYRGWLAQLDNVVPFGPPAGVEGNGYLSVCTLDSHDVGDVTATLAAAGISVGRVYPETIDQQPPAACALRFGDLSQGRDFCLKVVNLPLFYGMTDEQLEWVRTCFTAIVQGSDE